MAHDLTEEQIIAEGRVANAQTQNLVHIIERRDREIEGLRRQIQAWENMPHGGSKLRAAVESLKHHWETHPDLSDVKSYYIMCLRSLLADNPPDEPALCGKTFFGEGSISRSYTCSRDAGHVGDCGLKEPAPIDPAVVERLRQYVDSIIKGAFSNVGYFDIKSGRNLIDDLLVVVGALAPQEEMATQDQWELSGCEYCDTWEECAKAKQCLGSIGSPAQPSPISAREQLTNQLAQFGGACANYAAGNYGKGERAFNVLRAEASYVARLIVEEE